VSLNLIVMSELNFNRKLGNGSFCACAVKRWPKMLAKMMAGRSPKYPYTVESKCGVKFLSGSSEVAVSATAQLKYGQHADNYPPVAKMSVS